MRQHTPPSSYKFTVIFTFKVCTLDVWDKRVQLVGRIFVFVTLACQTDSHTEWYIPTRRKIWIYTAIQSINQFKTSIFSCLHGLDGLTYNTRSTHPRQPAAPPPPLFTHWKMIGSTAYIGRNRSTGTRGGASQVIFCCKNFDGRMPFLPLTPQITSAAVGLPDPVLCHSQDIEYWIGQYQCDPYRTEKTLQKEW